MELQDIGRISQELEEAVLKLQGREEKRMASVLGAGGEVDGQVGEQRQLPGTSPLQRQTARSGVGSPGAAGQPKAGRSAARIERSERPEESWRSAARIERSEGPEESALFLAVMELPQKYRVPVYLHYYEGYPVKECAALCGVKPSTMQTRMQRAREKLKKKLCEEEREN